MSANISELDGVADKVSPGTWNRADNKNVLFTFFNLSQYQGGRIFGNGAIRIYVIRIEGDKLEVNPIINHQFHRVGFGALLKSQKPFRSQIGIYNGDGMGEQGIEAFFIGLKCYPARSKDLQIGPNLMDVFGFVVGNHFFKHQFHPGGDAR